MKGLTYIHRIFALAISISLLPLSFAVAQDPIDQADQGMMVIRALEDSFHRVAETVIPAVVQLDVVDVVESQVTNSPFEFFFRQRNGEQIQPREFRKNGLGSGVIISHENGTALVLTNAHVAATAEEITVRLADGRSFPGVLVGSDERRDAALVSFESKEDVPVAVLGSSNDLQVGDWVLAIGSPLGFSSSMTSGIVSALGRHAGSGSGVADFTDYIQTDAAINQGNSGGPLVNLRGEVIGINTWIASNSGGSIGLGFSVPIDSMKPAIDQLATKGEVEYGWLGAYVSDIPNSLGTENGAWVSNIFINSPASRGGLLPGDIVTSINGQPVGGANDLIRIVGNTSPGDNLRMSLIRDGKRLEKRIRIDRRDSEADLASMQAKVWPGLIVTIDNEGNLRVAGLIQDSPSEVSGIKPGDIITKINGTEVNSIADYSKVLSETNPDTELRFRINRNGTQLIIGLIPAE